MFDLASKQMKKTMSWLFSFLICASLALSSLLLDSRSASASPIAASGSVRALPAFARKYGMPSSSCHQAWPKLTPFGQQFKDNGLSDGQ